MRMRTVPLFVAGSTAGRTETTTAVNLLPEAALVSTWNFSPVLISPSRVAGTVPRSSSGLTSATSTTGCAAVPSTCSPALTKRRTTVPAKGARTMARSSCAFAVASAACACFSVASATAAAVRASSTSLRDEMPRPSRPSSRCSAMRALFNEACAWATAASVWRSCSRSSVLSSSASSCPAATRSPSTTETRAMRPGTSGAILASRFGSEARLPVTIRLAAISPFFTFVTVTSGTALSVFSSAAFLPQAESASVSASGNKRRRRALVKGRSHGFLQRGKGSMRREKRVQIGLACVAQAALRVNEREQVALSGAVAFLGHLQQPDHLRHDALRVLLRLVGLGEVVVIGRGHLRRGIDALKAKREAKQLEPRAGRGDFALAVVEQR